MEICYLYIFYYNWVFISILGTVDENGDISPLVVIEEEPDFIDVNELSEDEHCVMPSSSEDEFSTDGEEEEDEEECSKYFIRDLLCDIEDIDAELHECIRRIEEDSYKPGNKRKCYDNIDDRTSKRKKKKKTKLKNGGGGCDNELVVAIDSDTVTGKSKDGADFVWCTRPCGNVSTDTDYTSAPVDCARDAKTPLDCFLTFFTGEMMEGLIAGTNEKISDYRRKQGSKSRTFADIENCGEIQALIGLLLYVAVKKDNHLPLSVMFDVGSAGARYRSIMSPQRLRLLLQCLTFDKKPPERNKFPEIWEMWETFISNCRSNYRPGRNVTVGDQNVRFTQKCPFRLSKNPEKYGLQSTLMVDSCTKYLVDALPIGAPLTSESLSKLTESIKSSKRNITFESPVGVSAISELRRNGITAVGILQNDPELPNEMLNPAFHNRQLRSSVFIHREEMTAVSYKTKSTEVVCYVSSQHCEPELGNKMPEIVVSYDSHKDGVRTFNKIVDSVNCARRTKRWTLTLFFNMLSLACANAYVVYLHNVYRGLCDVERNRPLSRFDFVVKLVDQLTIVWVRKRLMTYGSLSEDLFEQTRRSLLGFVGNSIDCRTEDKVAGMVKCDYCPEEARAGLKTCVTCGNCKKLVCRDHLSQFCCKCLVKC